MGEVRWVEIRWKDRESSCKAVVLPDETDVLIGALSLACHGAVIAGEKAPGNLLRKLPETRKGLKRKYRSKPRSGL
jgi:hypothetical protein